MKDKFEFLREFVGAFNKLTEETRTRISDLGKSTRRGPKEIYYHLAEEALRRCVRARVPYQMADEYDFQRRVKQVNTALMDTIAGSKTLGELERYIAEVLALAERPSVVLRPWVERSGCVLPLVVASYVESQRSPLAVETALWNAVRTRCIGFVARTLGKTHEKPLIGRLKRAQSLLLSKSKITKDSPLGIEEMNYVIFVSETELANRVIELLNELLREQGIDLTLTSESERTGAPPDVREPQYVFKKDGNNYIIRYRGGDRFSLRSLKGLRYIHILIRQQRHDIGVLVLREEAGEAPPIDREAAQRAIQMVQAGEVAGDLARPMLANPEFLNMLQSEIQDMESEIEEAEAVDDQIRVVNLTAQKDQLVQYLSTLVGRGRQMRDHTSPIERARKAVSNSIAYSKNQILENDESLFQHLQHSLRLGICCSYRPDSPIEWET